MPYREKTAWLYLIAVALTFGPYFALVASGAVPEAPLPNLRMMGLYAAVACAQMLILLVGHLVLRRAAPEDARTPPDERDRAIQARALNAGYSVLILGMILVGGIMPFVSAGWTIVNTTIFLIASAEVIRSCVTVVAYRRQS